MCVHVYGKGRRRCEDVLVNVREYVHVHVCVHSSIKDSVTFQYSVDLEKLIK